MKALALGLLLLAGCSAKPAVTDAQQPLSAAEVSEALRDALGRSIARAVAYAAQPDGFYGDPGLRIELPPGTAKLQDRLRELGHAAQLDSAVLQLNRAAEQAAPRARQAFLKAITAMPIDDPFGVLNGGRDAATRLLREEAGDELYDEIEPAVRQALAATGAARAYADLAELYNGLPGVYDVDPDITAYLTAKTVDGLFVAMARQEGQIREIPAARATRLLRRVFGSLD